MVDIHSLTFGYGKSVLFDGLNLGLQGGRAYGLLGLNGAGKTSLLKLIAGALTPASGEISAFGREPSKREAAHLADIAFVPEDPWLPSITPKDWLARVSVFRPAFDRARLEELRRDFALEENKNLSKLSYGQRKKFALATALASGARIVLLDEPTNGLDIPSKMQFRRALATSVLEDRILVVSTHQVRDLENLIDPILILDKGRLAFEIGADQMVDRLGTGRFPSLDGLDVVHAERDTLGWTALVARKNGIEGLGAPDIELVFNAALVDSDRLRTALAGEPLGPYNPDASVSRTGVLASEGRN